MDNIIEIKNISKTFSNNVHAVNDISFNIERGSIFGIIGMSGAGKSTLVRCLNFLEKPDKGSVIVNGKDLSALKDSELREMRRKIAMIFQHFNLLMQRTVLGNVCLPLEIAGVPKKEAEKRAMEMLEIVGLESKAHAYPATLSGGQKQRVAIARAIAGNPEILLCDEATSALDPGTTKAVLQLLKKINKELNITIVIITHEMSVVEAVCNKVAILDSGSLAEIGDVKEIFSSPKSIEGKKLILNDVNTTALMHTHNCVRIVFTENSSFEPVISNMTLIFKTPVNILYANTANIDSVARGEMILQLPDDEEVKNNMINYLKEHKLSVEVLDIKEVL